MGMETSSMFKIMLVWGWGWGLGIPTVEDGHITCSLFIAGSGWYLKLKPGGSPLTRVAQVTVAAVKKRSETVPGRDSKVLYQNKELDTDISVNGRLMHTEQFEWLDKAAAVTQDNFKNPNKPNLWRLATVHRVEEVKSIIRILPIWSARILLVTSSSHLGFFMIQQARSMDRHITKSIQFPPASLSIFSILTMLSGLVLYECLFVPFARKFTRNPSGITTLQRMGIGLGNHIFATLVSALVSKLMRIIFVR